MNKSLLILVAINLFLALVIAQSAGGKVQIDLYDESLCPYCREFVTGELKKAINTPNISLIADINIWPYGNAKETKAGGSYNYTCQHGAEECAGNLIEACALFKLNKIDYLNFSACLETQIDQSGTFAKAGPICANQTRVDYSLIQSCVNGYRLNFHIYKLNKIFILRI